MPGKTHKTAVVLIPPEELWEPIQEIRRLYDKHIARWMPHVTLLYPFRRREEFDALTGPLAEACRQVEPFDVELAEFRRLSHPRRASTLWLAPEPAETLGRLQESLWRVGKALLDGFPQRNRRLGLTGPGGPVLVRRLVRQRATALDTRPVDHHVQPPEGIVHLLHQRVHR